MKPHKTYDYVFPDIRDWPIFKLSEDRDAFMEEVIAATSESILKGKYKGGLSEEIARVLYAERRRLKEEPWKVDPADEDDFWKTVRKDLIRKSLDDDASEQAIADANKIIVERIVRRYVNEITGSFKISAYRFARRMLTIVFRTVLNAASFRSIRRMIGIERAMDEKVSIIGNTDKVRDLATKGTVILVPTHFSNLDSVLIGWVADRTGLPAFSYGAGLNLYNSAPFAFFMRRLGAYTVDRRKKNTIYLETLKTFSKLSVKRGTHSLFFPGGTRSRSGQLENRLKLGLLGSVIDAQGEHFAEGRDEKIFLVPLTLNYHFTLEAKSLIEQYLANTGKELYLTEKKPFGGFRGLLRFFWQLFRVSSEIVINYGKPIDVMGNFVDDNGDSLDQFGEKVKLSEYFMSNGEIRNDRQRNEQYTQRTADFLVDRYYAENVVLTSHLLAYTAFKVFQKTHPALDLYGILRLPQDEWVIPNEDFRAALEKAIERLLELAKGDKVTLSYPVLHGSVDDIIRHGLDNLGAYHPKNVLKQDKEGNFMSEDINLLYYYHNRMDGYGIKV